MLSCYCLNSWDMEIAAMFQARLLFGLLLLLGATSQKNEDEEEGRPYEFSFTIDGEQHRYEKKDVNGIIQGEFGFITADGIYHVTVYATDENGSFKILSMKNIRISEPLDQGGKPTTASLIRQSVSKQQPTEGIQSKPAPPAVKSVFPAAKKGPAVPKPISSTTKPERPISTTSRPIYDFTTASTIRNGCGGCGIVTKAPAGPLPFQNPVFQKQRKEEKKPLPPPGQPVSYSEELLPPSSSLANNVPSGLIPKPFSPAGQPSNPSASLPSGPTNPGISSALPGPPQTFLLAPGTNAGPTYSNSPIEQNPFGPRPAIPTPASKPVSTTINTPLELLGPRPPIASVPISQPRGQIQNGLQNPVQYQIPGNSPSVLSQVTVSDGIIKVPGNKPIPIKDKYPNMVDGLPDGVTERDITDLLYKFNYTVGFHGHYEKGLKNGAKIGGYFVNGRDGFSRVVTYVADENGYRPKFKLINLGLDSDDTPKPGTEKTFGLKNFEFIWYPIKQ